MSQPNSRAPSQTPSAMSDAASDHEDAPPAQPAQSPRRQSRHRRRRPRSLSASSEEEEGPRRRSTKNTSGLPAVSEVEDTTRGLTKTAGGVVNQVGNTAGQLTGGGEKEATGSDKPLKLRLDVNLDVEITLEARVHGDLTLALLQALAASFMDVPFRTRYRPYGCIQGVVGLVFGENKRIKWTASS